MLIKPNFFSVHLSPKDVSEKWKEFFIELLPNIEDQPVSRFYAALTDFATSYSHLLPPNSNVTGVRYLLAASRTILPTVVDPV